MSEAFIIKFLEYVMMAATARIAYVPSRDSAEIEAFI